MRAAVLALMLTACAASREPLEPATYAGTMTVEGSDEIGSLEPESWDETVTIAEDAEGLYVVAGCPMRLSERGAIVPTRCDLVEGGTTYSVEVLGGEAQRSGDMLTLRYESIVTTPRQRAELVSTFVGARSSP